ncbi:MAG TPA: c-type cytochrome biogenesis protein CcmI [Stellaceae bacterium]|nr:c-type cytochrome biogenesis protein CcmI [Stellaceae bacterium]
MLLAAALAVTCLAVVATVVLPLMKPRLPGPERAAFDRAVYRDQLRALERDASRGLIDAGDAAGARLEIERRLLAADAAEDEAPAQADGSAVLAVSLALAVPAAAVLIYLALGAPGVPDQPYAERAQERALAAAGGDAAAEKTAAALEQRLKANPDNAEDWLLLARSEAALGLWQKSTEAYRQALRLTQDRPDIAADYGETLAMAADGIVTPEARAAFGAALAGDPGNVVARFYLALGAAQEGHGAAAIAAWQALAAEQPADSPLRAELKRRIEDVAREAGLAAPALAAPAPGPSEAQQEAAARMTPEARQQMIRGMVEGLAVRLEADPSDAEGWLRLGRAYDVLGERDKSAAAYEHAAKLRPEDTRILVAEAEALLPEGKPETALPEQAVSLLKRAETLDPKQPAALWYLGLAAAQQRHFAEASGYWQRLLAVLPPESEQRQAVAEAIQAIQGK